MKKCREIGWVIKMSNKEKYLAGPSGGGWVADTGQAIMFLRKIDAESMLEVLRGLEVAAGYEWGDPHHVVVERVVPL